MFTAITQDAQGIAAAFGTAFCWSMTALFFSAAARRVGQFHVNQIRLVQACVLLALACLVTGAFSSAPTNQLILLAASGLVGLTLGDAALFLALQIIGPRRGSLIMALSPGFAALLMVPLLGETLSWIGVVGMIVTIAGVMWVVLERGQPGEIEGNAGWGVFWGVLGALGQAGGLILSKAGLGMRVPGGLLNSVSGITSSNVESLSPLYGTLVRMLAGTVILVGYGIIVGRFGQTLKSLKDRKALGQTSAGAIFGPFIGVTLSLAAVAWTNTAVAATIMAISPVLVIPIVRIVYKQAVTWRAVIGALIAFAGVAVLTFRERLAQML
ncbi:MAG: DMT family transporter [Planctomycetes bacterium]|nr:DMT family transporter [Planctomycetota bacterium]